MTDDEAVELKKQVKMKYMKMFYFVLRRLRDSWKYLWGCVIYILYKSREEGGGELG